MVLFDAPATILFTFPVHVHTQFFLWIVHCKMEANFTQKHYSQKCKVLLWCHIVIFFTFLTWCSENLEVLVHTRFCICFFILFLTKLSLSTAICRHWQRVKQGILSPKWQDDKYLPTVHNKYQYYFYYSNCAASIHSKRMCEPSILLLLFHMYRYGA